MLYIYYNEKIIQIWVKKYIHFEILKLSLVDLLHICSHLKERLIFLKIMKPKIYKCKRVTGPWKSTNLYCVHIFHTMKWKYVQLSHHLLLIDSVTFKHDMGKCVCIYLIDDLKLNHGRIWLYIAHQIFSLLIYPKQKLPNQITQT